MIGNLNPDAFIRERIFQRIVDRTGIAPQKAKWTFFRVFAIGILLSYGSMVTIQIGSAPAGSTDPTLVIAMMLVAVATIAAVHVQVRAPQHEAFDIFIIGMRLICVVAGCTMAWHSIGMVIGAEKTGMAAGLTMHSITVSWFAGVAASYLNVCRNPPPRVPRTRMAPVTE